MDKKDIPASNIKSIWPRKDPFAKPENKPKPEDNPKDEGAAVHTVEDETPAKAAPGNLDELKARGKVPTVIKVVDFTGAAEGNMLKMTVAVRNCGDALARDVKVKCIGNARLSLISSPMATVGDIVPRSKSIAQFAFGMPDNFCEEYANFAVSAEAENAKPYSQLFTLKTGRRVLTATEVMEKMQAEMRAQKGGKPEKDGKH